MSDVRRVPAHMLCKHEFSYTNCAAVVWRSLACASNHAAGNTVQTQALPIQEHCSVKKRGMSQGSSLHHTMLYPSFALLLLLLICAAKRCVEACFHRPIFTTKACLRWSLHSLCRIATRMHRQTPPRTTLACEMLMSSTQSPQDKSTTALRPTPPLPPNCCLPQPSHQSMHTTHSTVETEADSCLSTQQCN